MNNITTGQELKNKILSALDKIADPVCSTLGPYGKTIILHNKTNKPIITKDGVSIAKVVTSADPVENAIIEVLKQSAESTLKNAGDGTTTTIALARAIVQNCLRKFNGSFSISRLKDGMEHTFGVLKNNLKKITQPVKTTEDIRKIANICTNGDVALAEIIAKAFEAIGKDGSIAIRDSATSTTSLLLEEGFKYDSGFIANAFINDERLGYVRYEDVNVFITDFHLNEITPAFMTLLSLAEREQRPLVIVAENVEGAALSSLIYNNASGVLKSVVVKAPKFGIEKINLMEDLAIATGATFFSRISGKRIEDITTLDFGKARILEASKSSTLIVGGNSKKEKLENRINQLRQELKQNDNIKECEKIQERISRLSGSVAIIKVGGSTEAEKIEKKHRIEDALEAVNVAIEEGIVPGGGMALIKAWEGEIEDGEQEFLEGQSAIIEALGAPLYQMLINYGYDVEEAEQIVNKAHGLDKNDAMGIDIKTGETIDLYKRGVLDPVKVPLTALENAISVASLIVSTSFVITDN